LRFRDRAAFIQATPPRFLPGRETIPLWVDHEEARQIGEIKTLYRLDWIDGPWLVGSGIVRNPAAWLGRDASASFAHWPTLRRE